MSQHRAPKRRRADKHQPAAKAASSPSSPPPSPSPPPAAGRHRAAHAAPSTKSRTRASTPPNTADTANTASTTPSTAPDTAPGRARRGAPAAARVPRERRGFTRPSGYLVAGTSALVVAAAGAMSVGSAQAMRPEAGERVAAFSTPDAAQAPYTGTDATGLGARTVRDGRPATISRNADRVALNRAQQRRLEEAAEQQAAARNRALAQLADQAQDRAQQIRAHMWQLPMSDYYITAGFGDGGGLWSSDHTGLDFAAPYGATIGSVSSGEVTETGYFGDYGNRVVVTTPDGTDIWYCHMGSIYVSEGEQVSPGSSVGAIGMTGNTTGPHLHLEVHPGGGPPVDPYTALVAHGLDP